jgi:general secretion pathway protein G
MTMLTRQPRKACRTAPAAFTLVELLIVVVILGIMAMIVIPQFSNASLQARENTLRDDLRFLRTQIGVFAAQHRDVCPGYPGGDTSASPTEAEFIDQMTLHTDERCNTNPSATPIFKYGPYLTKMPPNPINGRTDIMMIDNGVPLPAVDDSTGWIYKAQTKEILANLTGTDATGTPYAQY